MINRHIPVTGTLGQCGQSQPRIAITGIAGKHCAISLLRLGPALGLEMLIGAHQQAVDAIRTTATFDPDHRFLSRHRGGGGRSCRVIESLSKWLTPILRQALIQLPDILRYRGRQAGTFLQRRGRGEV